jgi:hypothetical protein
MPQGTEHAADELLVLAGKILCALPARGRA